MRELQECHSRFTVLDYLVPGTLALAVVVRLVLWLTSTDGLSERGDPSPAVMRYHRAKFTRSVDSVFAGAVLLVFFDNVAQFLGLILYVKSGVFGIFDFALLQARSSLVVYALVHLGSRERDDCWFHEYEQHVLVQQTKQSQSPRIIMGRSFKARVQSQAQYHRMKMHFMQKILQGSGLTPVFPQTTTADRNQPGRDGVARGSLERIARFKPRAMTVTRGMDPLARVTRTRKAVKNKHESLIPSNFQQGHSGDVLEVPPRVAIPGTTDRVGELNPRQKRIDHATSSGEQLLVQADPAGHELADAGPEPGAIPREVVYAKNVGLFACAFLLVGHRVYALTLLVYSQVMFAFVLVAKFGFRSRSCVAVLASECFLGIFLVQCVFYEALAETQAWAESVFVAFYLGGLSVSVAFFLFDAVQKLKLKVVGSASSRSE